MATTTRRAVAVLVTGFVAVAAAALVPDAAAFEQEGMTIRENETVEASFPPIPGNNAALVHYPDTCATATYCDVVPLDVIVPETLDAADDFIIKITLTWPEQAADTPGYRGSTNDLDFYVYDDKQEETANPPEDGSEPGYTEKTSGASDQNPEVAQLFRPTLGRYNMVVNNFLGTNVGYTFTLEWQSFEADPAIEILAPPPDGSTRSSTTSTTSRATTTTTSGGDTAETAVSIPEAVVLPDDDFEGGAFDAGGGTDDLAALDEGGQRIALGQRAAESPGAASVLLWMLGLPAVLVGAVAVFLVRRGRRVRRAAQPA